jgi:ElaB/YqjD/DUF883 family membrane-anchored ribosome-binding protein
MAEQEDLRREVDDLKAHMSAIRTDLAALAESLKGMGRERADAAATRLRSEGERVRASVQQARDEARLRGEAGLATLEAQIEEKPFVSVLTALGVGILIGRLLLGRD